jgi:hypothetical protein
VRHSCSRVTRRHKPPPDRTFADALAWHAKAGRPVEQAQTELAYGERLRRAGRRVDAREQLRTALATFERTGARLFADRAAKEPREGRRTVVNDTDFVLRTRVRTTPDAPKAHEQYVDSMAWAERDQEPAGTVPANSTEEGPALRDAAAAAARVDADERQAMAIRDQLRDEAPSTIEPDERIAPHLQPNELVLGLRQSAILRPPGEDRALGYGGTLYLTTQRLVHVGQMTVSVQLSNIVETAVAGERLLITLREGDGVSLDVDRPRTLSTEIAAAVRGLRT